MFSYVLPLCLYLLLTYSNLFIIILIYGFLVALFYIVNIFIVTYEIVIKNVEYDTTKIFMDGESTTARNIKDFNFK